MSIPLEILGSGVNLFVYLFVFTGAKSGNGTMIETRGMVHPVRGATFGYVTFADVASYDEEVLLAHPRGEALRTYSSEANLDLV